MIMKKDIVLAKNIFAMRHWWCRVGFILALLFAGMYPSVAQETQVDTTAAPETTEEPAAEEVEEIEEETTIKSKMTLSADQYPDGTILLNGLLRAKIDGSYQKVPDKKVEFFVLNVAGEESLIGDTMTSPAGVAKIKVDKASLTKGEDGSYSFIARYGGDEKFEESESDLILKSATLTMESREEDSTYVLSLTAAAETPEGPQPIVGAVVSVYIKRMFSSFKVAEGETDDAGMVEVEFPAGLAGDENGNLEITAMIEETEEYGNLSVTATQQWGYEVSLAIIETPRALWSPHPPTWMVITFFILMGAVWIHYAIVIYNMIKIRSHGRHVSDKA